MPADALKIVSLVALPAAVIATLGASAFGPFEVSVLDPLQPPHRPDSGVDAVLIGADHAAAPWATAAPIEHALVVVSDALSADAVLPWMQRGAQDVVSRADLLADALPRRLRCAIERQRRERDARTAYATDLATGLPHRQQLIEHMSHLLALREREPSPMALLVLRIEGLATAEVRLGRESSNVLRRRLAVRLRAGVRASDVVASLGADTFAVLLGSLLTADDAHRVGAKLLEALLKPVQVAGDTAAVAVSLGLSQYPQDGAQPEALLKRAVGLAASAQAQGRAGLANFVEAGGRTPDAANDAAITS